MAPDYKAGAKEWFAKADIDEKSMRILQGSDGPKETVCFLAEQWVEKYLKGFLTLHQKKFRFVHDLPYLIGICAEIDPEFEKFRESSNELSDLYLALRYPIDLPSSYDTGAIVSKSEAIVKHVKSKIGLPLTRE